MDPADLPPSRRAQPRPSPAEPGSRRRVRGAGCVAGAARRVSSRAPRKAGSTCVSGDSITAFFPTRGAAAWNVLSRPGREPQLGIEGDRTQFASGACRRRTRRQPRRVVVLMAGTNNSKPASAAGDRGGLARSFEEVRDRAPECGRAAQRDPAARAPPTILTSEDRRRQRTDRGGSPTATACAGLTRVRLSSTPTATSSRC